jgi:hypothetical protein
MKFANATNLNRKSGFAPVGMTKCRAEDYLEIGESDRRIRRTEFFRKL